MVDDTTQRLELHGSESVVVCFECGRHKRMKSRNNSCHTKVFFLFGVVDVFFVVD